MSLSAVVGRERKGCVGPGCLGVEKSPKDRISRVVRYVFLGFQGKSDGIAMDDPLDLEVVA